MFIGLVALQSGTSMRVCPGSHRHGGEFIDVQLVEFDKYEFIICHPKLIHSGCGATKFNYRLHFYHGLPKKLSLQTDYPKIRMTTRSEQLGNARKALAIKSNKDAELKMRLQRTKIQPA
jgi:hypothetical protein